MILFNPNNHNRPYKKEHYLKIIKAPVPNPERLERIYQNHIHALKDVYMLKDKSLKLKL